MPRKRGTWRACLIKGASFIREDKESFPKEVRITQTSKKF